jgi:hypothetical protein
MTTFAFELPAADLAWESLGLVVHKAGDAVVEHGRHAEQRACEQTGAQLETTTTAARGTVQRQVVRKRRVTLLLLSNTMLNSVPASHSGQQRPHQTHSTRKAG